MTAAVADSSALYAAADDRDPDHERVVAALVRSDLQVVIPALVVTEVAYLLGSRFGSEAEATFLESLADQDVEPPAPSDWARIAELVGKYADFPLGGVDASVVALAERLQTPVVITLDERHFRAIRPRHCEALELLPG